MEAPFNCIRDGIIAFDMNGYITSIKPAFEEMIGNPKNDILGNRGSEIAACILLPRDFNEVLIHFNRAVGCAAFLQKPFNIEDLSMAVQKALFRIL